MINKTSLTRILRNIDALRFRQKVSSCSCGVTHWNRNIILMKMSSLVTSKVVKITDSGTASDENVVKLTYKVTFYKYLNSFFFFCHYNGVIMGAIASQITSLTIVYSTVYSDADQRKHQSCCVIAITVAGNYLIHSWRLWIYKKYCLCDFRLPILLSLHCIDVTWAQWHL